MTTIATLNIAISGNTANYTTKLDSVRKNTKSAVADLKSAGGGGIFGGLTTSVTSVSAGLLAAGEVLHVFGQGLSFVSGAAEHAVTTISQWVSETTAAVDAAYKMAGALGISTTALMSLGQAAKVNANVGTEEFTTLLTKMTKAIGEVNLRGGPAKEALNLLGLSAKNLAAIPVDKQFLAVADAISKLKSPTDQAIAATELFGRTGAAMLPLLTQGADAIGRAQQEAVKYGTALSQIDAAKIEESHRAVQELGERWEGIKNTLVIALAPAITAIAAGIQAAIPPADQLKTIFTEILFIAADFADSLNSITDLMTQFATLDLDGIIHGKDDHTFTDFLKTAITLSDKLAQQMSGIHPPATVDTAAIDTATKLKTALDSIKMESATAGLDTLNKRLLEFTANLHPSAAQIFEFAKALQHIQAVAAQTKISNTLDGLKESAAVAGMTEMQKVIHTLTMEGASFKQIMEGISLEGVIEQASHLKDITAQIKSLTEQNQTPVEKYLATMRMINDLAAHGLSMEIAKRAAIKANQDLLNSYKSTDTGTFQAREVRFGLTPNVARNADPMTNLKAAIDRQTEIQKKQLTEEQLTNRLLRDNGIDVVDIGT